ITSEKVTYPLLLFSTAAAGIGHINVIPDTDGSIRRSPMAITYGDGLYPTYALELLRVYLGLDSKDIKIIPGDRLTLGKLETPHDASGLMTSPYRGPEQTFVSPPFFDVLNEKVTADQFKDKIVLLGPTATGLGSQYVTPVGATFPGVELV